MAQVVFTPNLERHLQCPPRQVEAETVRDALEKIFEGREQLRGYVLDDQGALRHHVTVFVDGVQVRDRTRLAEPVEASTEIYVMQALSGG
ncbi:MAG: MoaD/ThiS family protein [Polyangiaceae bacterium]